eukprot:CAMPEP_0114993254 /NCGR_PEP_ID=MMETSP0216-20121206/12420_1 /TAXON_ID=223996 /ORGANISM="Protocruzia adherens, Strain Boccale" /LENGTH=250 /DNA_ID=CAMNT_0002356861 /DNA_START=864 /DNA_END=1616 /DNA_ORIENTATION=-
MKRLKHNYLRTKENPNHSLDFADVSDRVRKNTSYNIDFKKHTRRPSFIKTGSGAHERRFLPLSVSPDVLSHRSRTRDIRFDQYRERDNLLYSPHPTGDLQYDAKYDSVENRDNVLLQFDKFSKRPEVDHRRIKSNCTDYFALSKIDNARSKLSTSRKVIAHRILKPQKPKGIGRKLPTYLQNRGTRMDLNHVNKKMLKEISYPHARCQSVISSFAISKDSQMPEWLDITYDKSFSIISSSRRYQDASNYH